MNAVFYKMISEIASNIQANKDFLTDLDREIGDGDHGINMARGFSNVMSKLNVDEEMSISDSLKKVGMIIISTVGGASGPLYGSAFLKAAMATRNHEQVDGELFGIILKASLEGIQERGKATRGDKTIIDALEPACEIYFKGINEGKSTIECMQAACKAAEGGVESTKLIAARKGRASYLGERSIGHQDPGATSTLIMLQSITDVLVRQEA